jgi:Ferritin-like domain
MTDSTDIQTIEPAPVPDNRHSRRSFFAIGGTIAAGAVIVACSSDDSTGSDPTTTGASDPTTTTMGESPDVAIATFAAGLELLAANTYTAALDAASSGDLGEVPPAVAEYATTAQAHHQAYSDALAEAAGGITPEVPADIEATINAGFADVTDIPGLAQFALDFELAAAATYLDVLPKLTSKAAIDLVGSILPVTRQRASILLFALGKYPVPETFATPEGSLAPS